MIVFFKIWIEGDSKESVLLFAEDFDLSKRGPVSGDGMNPADSPLEFDQVNRTIGPKIHAHGTGEIFRDGFNFESERFNPAGEVGEGKEEKCFQGRGHSVDER